MADLIADLKDYTEAVAHQHDLKAVTLQVVDRSRSDQKMMQIVEFSIPAEANWSYREDGVHLEDPFTSIEVKEVPELLDDETLLGLDDPRIWARAANAPMWRYHIERFSLKVEGVSVRRLRKGIYLVAAFLRDSDRIYDAPPPRQLLQNTAYHMHNMMCTHLLTGAVKSNAGLLGLRGALEPEELPCALDLLSAREVELARHVVMGCQTKEVAHRMNLSKFTVDNHLRRIYSKLGIHNRTELSRLIH
ncbi:MAG: hypothetical protein DI568_08210 [Sphingomonas sp.]|nr:MAG: hypothetical protein DI568_08210 [Sphingomonas sp.]